MENLRAVHDITRAADTHIWLHADACWGLMCAFTPELAGKLDGIEDFDSVTVDQHKVMDIPYAMSALLVRDPAALRLVSSYSDLIMQEDFAFGQVTPFIGTKEWSSVKLWAMMRAHGRAGLADLMSVRLITTRTFTSLVDDNPRLLRRWRPGPPGPCGGRPGRPGRGGAASRPGSRSGRPAGCGRRTAAPRTPSRFVFP